jgi:hypothetical protein
MLNRLGDGHTFGVIRVYVYWLFQLVGRWSVYGRTGERGLW